MGEDEREAAPGTGPGRLAGRPPAPGACDVEVAPGAVRVTVPDPGGGGPFRVDIPVETHPALLKRAACTLFLKRPKWRAALEIGHPPDLDSLARAVAKATRFGPPRLDLGRAACDCGARPGRCRHAKAAVAAARGTLSGFPVRQLRARGFDVEEWARSPEFTEAAGTPRRLSVCWKRAWETWEARPLEEMPDLTAIPRLLEETAKALTPTPFGPNFDKVLRKGMAAAAERAGWLRDRADPAVTLDSLGPLDVTVNVNGEAATLSGRDEYRPGVYHLEYTAWLAAHRGRGTRLVNALAQVAPEEAGRLGATGRYWAMLYRYVEALTLQGALVPELVHGRTDESRKFVWRPATMLSEPVRAIHRRFVDACPPDLLRMREIHDPERLMRSSREMQVRHAVDLLFRGILGWDDDASAPGRPDLGEKVRDASATVFGLGPLWQRGFAKDPDDWEILEWLRRLSIPAELPGMVLELAPEEDDPEKFGGGLVFVDADDNPMPLGDVLDRECSVWHLLALDSLSGLLDTDLEFKMESTGLDFTVGIGDFPEFFLAVLHLTGRIRVRLAVADELVAMGAARMCYRMSARGGRGAARLDLAALAALDWKVGVGDRWFDPGEFEPLAAAARKEIDEMGGFVRFGSTLYFPVKEPLPILRHFSGGYALMDHRFAFTEFSASPPGPTDGLSHLDLLRAAVSGELHGADVEPDPSARRLLDEALSPRERPDPPGALAGVLRPHQRAGFEWLAHNADIGFGSVLADDAGLGKTLQAIALILHRTLRDPSHKTLVAAPAASLTRWSHEIGRFAPGLRTQVRRGGADSPDPGQCDVVVASHGAVGKDADTLGARAWGLLVVDEAQKIGNPASQQAKAIRGCEADARVALAGIPVGDRPDDCWAIFDLVNPGYLWSRREFRRELGRPIGKEGDRRALERFRRLVAPFVLRRTETDKGIARDVPGKAGAP